MKIRYVAATLLLLTSVIAFADPICSIENVNYIDLPNLIKMSDAIVILRVERNLSDTHIMSSFYSKYECYIYQTLKGDLPKNTRVKIQLYGIEGSLKYPYARGSIHLIFLVKKTDENEPTDYRMLTVCGAETLLRPSGHEKMPEGKTVEEQVKCLVRDAIDYQTEEYQKRMRFLNIMLGNSPNDELSTDDGK
jgi:hypothetical protein